MCNRCCGFQAIQGLQYSHYNRSMLASVSDDASLVLWDTNARRSVHQFARAHKAPATDLSFSPCNDKLLLSSGLDKRIVLYDVQNKRWVCLLCQAMYWVCVLALVLSRVLRLVLSRVLGIALSSVLGIVLSHVLGLCIESVYWACVLDLLLCWDAVITSNSLPANVCPVGSLWMRKSNQGFSIHS